MATLQKIRNRGGLLVAIIIGLALVAFILGDMLRSGSSIMQGSRLEIMEVNGEAVQYADFQHKVDEFAEVYKMNSGQTTLDDKAWTQLREQVFQNLVREMIMNERYEELGVAVSSVELAELVKGNNPHSIIRNVFKNPQTGEFDKAFLIEFLKRRDLDPTGRSAIYWKTLEDQIFNDRLQSKYINLLAKGLYVTKVEAEESLKAKNNQVSLEFVKQNFTAIPDSAITVSEKELRAYYDTHKDDYKQTDSRKIEYVSFQVKPSESDDTATKKWAEELTGEFEGTEDNVQFINMNADTPFEDTYFKKEELPADIGEWAFSVSEGSVYGPYKENDIYKLAKVHQFKQLPDSVKVRHILIKPATQAALEKAEATIDSLKTLVKNGANFAQLARKYSEDKGSASEGGNLGWFKRNRMYKPFEEACFNAKAGDIVVARTPAGIHLIKVDRLGKTTNQVQLGIIDRKVQASSQTFQNIYQQANQFAGENRNKEAFENAVVEQKLNKHLATVKETDRTINRMENARLLVRAAYRAKAGEILTDHDGSPVFEIGDNFIIAILSQANEEGYASFEDVKTRVELNVKKEKKAEALKKQFEEVLAGRNTLEAVAAKFEIEIERAENISFNSYSLPKSGTEPAVIGAAAFAEEGKVVGPIKGKNGVFAIKVTKKTAGEDTDVDAEQTRLAQSIAYRANYQAYQALKDASEITDERARFY